MKVKSATAKNVPSVIEIKDLKISFGNFEVLKGANLNLYKGENLVVLGKSGTGKSVLIKIIVGLLKANSGLVKVLDNDIDSLIYKDLLKLRLRVGFSFQNSALYDSMTIRENLEFPLVRNRRHLTKQEINAAVEEVLEAVGLTQTINQMPLNSPLF